MKLARLTLALLLLLTTPPASLSGENDRLREAVRTLDRVPAGRELLGRATRQWKLGRSEEVLRRFRWGEVSRTDAVLTRHFRPETGEETRERQVTVFIKRDQRFEDLVLDVAHELTHAITPPSWDPYDPELTPSAYIRASLEGPGGEVEALDTECRIALELETAVGFEVPRCRRYRDPQSGRLSRARIVEDFYRVGRWRAPLLKSLGAQAAALPPLSDAAPQLLSSTGRAPYPVALLREFEELNEIACENSRRRVTLAQAANGRGPAAESEPAVEGSRRLLRRRCAASARR